MKVQDNMNNIIHKIRSKLKSNADKKTRQGFERFFKEKVKCYGVKTGVVSKIAKKYWQEVRGLSKKEIFSLCEELYSSDYCEEAFIVSNWVPNLVNQFELEDMATFKKWIEKYINNWAKCDGFCNHTVGDFIEKYPQYVEELKKWAKSPSRWLQRASAVSLIIPVKKGQFWGDIFEIADELLETPDDMVQKGYGWLLKEASRKHQKDVFEYIMKHKKDMPRTALRYAIELMPQHLKTKAMKRD